MMSMWQRAARWSPSLATCCLCSMEPASSKSTWPSASRAGLFDVSHMGEILFTGPTALDTLNHLLTNDYSGMP